MTKAVPVKNSPLPAQLAAEPSYPAGTTISEAYLQELDKLLQDPSVMGSPDQRSVIEGARRIVAARVCESHMRETAVEFIQTVGLCLQPDSMRYELLPTIVVNFTMRFQALQRDALSIAELTNRKFGGPEILAPHLDQFADRANGIFDAVSFNRDYGLSRKDFDFLRPSLERLYDTLDHFLAQGRFLEVPQRPTGESTKPRSQIFDKPTKPRAA